MQAGLDRLPQMLEAVRMGAIAPRAEPVVRQGPAARLSVDAGQGFADAAIDAAFDTLLDLAVTHGIAAATVVRTGDAPVPRPWLRRFGGHGVLGLAVADPEGRSASYPTVAASQGEFRIEGLAQEMLAFLIGANRRSEAADAGPFVSCEGSMCILTMTSATGAGPGWAAVSDQQQMADTTGVDVSSELLARILS